MSNLALWLATALLVGCSDDARTPGIGDVDAGRVDAGEGEPDHDDAGEPLPQGPYMASVTLRVPDDSLAAYTAVIPEIDGTSDELLRDGYETVGQTNYLVPSSYDGFVYLPGGANPTITKMRVDANREFVEEGIVSFAGLGATTVLRAPVIGADMVTADKAYYYDNTTRTMVVWNPRTMQLTDKVIDLHEVLTDGIEEKWLPVVFLNYGEGFSRTRGNRLFVPVRWSNWDDPNDAQRASAGLLVIDTERDEVVHLLQDDRIADSIYTVLTDSGDLYLFTGAIGVTQHLVHGSVAPAGVLRVRAGEDTFDPDYFLDLSKELGGRQATTPAWWRGTEVFVRAYHEERGPQITDDIKAEPYLLLSERAWRYWKVDLAGEHEAEHVDTLPWTSTDGYFYRIAEENRLFLGVMAEDFANTSLYEVTDDGFSAAVQVRGTLDVLSRVHRKL
ncbi:MAG TPA: DUF4374 domain-containing protein [Polyangiales bacterium]